MITRYTLAFALLTFLCTCGRAQIPLDTSRQLDRDVWFTGGDRFGGTSVRNGIRFTDEGPEPYNNVRLNIDLSGGNTILTNPGNGEVLAYSNGKVVVDGSNRIMPGGEDLDGNPLRNGSLFIPDPSDCNRWRLLHQEFNAFILYHEAYYAVIDMNLPGNGTLANPLGEVSEGSRRIFSSSFADGTSIGMNAILKAPNSREAWIFTTSTLRRELIVLNSDAAGISIHRSYSLDELFPDQFENADRIISNSIEYHEDAPGRGRLLLSVVGVGDETGDALVGDEALLGFIDFDRINGEVTQDRATLIINDCLRTYDAIFSPDGSKAYWTTFTGTDPDNCIELIYALKQYDFATGQVTTLTSVSGVSGNASIASPLSNIALGPDKKLYTTQFVGFVPETVGQTLSAVSRPDQAGGEANFDVEAYQVSTASGAVFAVPTFAVQPRAPEIRAAYQQTGCDSVEYLLSATAPPWGATPFSYRWNTGENGPEIMTPAAGRYDLTVTDADGCEQYARLEFDPVELDAERQAPTIVQQGSNCPGSALRLQALAPNTNVSVESFLWQTPSGQTLTTDQINIPNIDDAELSRYQLSYVDINGCPGPTDSFNLEVARTDFSLGLDTIVCDTAYTFSIAGPLEEIIWNTYVVGPEITVTNSGTYGFVAFTPEGCIVSDSVAVTVLPPVTSVLPDTMLVLEGEETTLAPFLAGGNLGEFNWQSSDLTVCPDCPRPIVRGEQEGLISLTATDLNSGCPISDATYLRILRNRDVYVPNAFRPNGDGINDRFTVYTKTPETIIEAFTVYNRWGGEVFAATEIPVNNQASGWDGRSNGESADLNTYAYYLVLRFIDGRKRAVKGEVYLIR